MTVRTHMAASSPIAAASGPGAKSAINALASDAFASDVFASDVLAGPVSAASDVLAGPVSATSDVLAGPVSAAMVQALLARESWRATRSSALSDTTLASPQAIWLVATERTDAEPANGAADTLATPLTNADTPRLPLGDDAFAARMAAVEAESIARAAMLDEIRAWQRVATWAQARAFALTREFTDACEASKGPLSGRSTAAAEIGWLCSGGETWGEVQVELAQDLDPDPSTGRLPQLAALVAAGDLPLSHARAVLEAGELLSAEAMREVDVHMIRYLAKHRAATENGQLIPPVLSAWRQVARRSVIRVDPDGAARTRARAVRDRAAWQRHHRDGTTTISCTLPAVDAAGVWQTLTALAEDARRDDGEIPRTLDQARVDTFASCFADLVERRAADGTLPAPSGRTRVEVQVVIDLATLLALRENPGELPGVGPIDPELARVLATDAAWRRLITDPITGDLLDRGAQTYSPGIALKDFVLSRHPSCTMPGCTRRAWHCQLDHITPWQAGNTAQPGTTRDNLHPVCQHDHNRKTHQGWTVTRSEDGLMEWTSPHGLTYTETPPP